MLLLWAAPRVCIHFASALDFSRAPDHSPNFSESLSGITALVQLQKVASRDEMCHPTFIASGSEELDLKV